MWNMFLTFQQTIQYPFTTHTALNTYHDNFVIDIFKNKTFVLKEPHFLLKNTIARQVQGRFFNVYCTFESLENLKEKKIKL